MSTVLHIGYKPNSLPVVVKKMETLSNAFYHPQACSKGGNELSQFSNFPCKELHIIDFMKKGPLLNKKKRRERQNETYDASHLPV